MEAFNVWKFLHIASMFVAVSIFVGQGMLSGVVARTGDVRAVRRCWRRKVDSARSAVSPSC
jgi:hypothetical protein